MRIGILTLPLHTNYGGILQAYALQTVLERMGHNVYVINKSPYKKKPLLKELFRRITDRIRGKKSLGILHEFKYNRRARQLNKYTSKFIINNIKQYICKDISSDINEDTFDIIIVGSDQIWRPEYIKNSGYGISGVFLGFTKEWNIKRISYAASFGTDSPAFSESEKDSCRKMLGRFSALSLREYSGINIMKHYFNLDAVCVLDPTMLLDRDDYLSLIKNSKIKDDVLFSYILDPDEILLNNIRKLANVNGLFSVVISDNHALRKKSPQLPVESWLYNILNSKVIITDSFHGCVFSIIFNKPFWVLCNHNRGNARFDSLLNLYKLQDRIITQQDILNIDLDNNIDWDLVNKIRRDNVSASISFLNQSIRQ